MIEDDMLTDVNIQHIEKDAERIRSFNKTENEKEYLNDDVDDLSKYVDDDDEGLKVLKDTTSMNRKAIFHDLNRLKHWRESIDHSKPEEVKENEIVEKPGGKQIEPIMENNMDIILNSLPDVHLDSKADDEIDNKAAIDKLNKIEEKLVRKYSLKK